MGSTGEKFEQLVGLAAGPPASAGEERRPPPAGAPTRPRTLTVGIPTHGSFEGVQLTLAALRLGHSDVLDRIAFLIVDTDPRGPEAWSLKALEWEIPDLRYVPAADLNALATAKDRIFHEANSEWVLCMEPHVVLAPGALAAMLAFADAHPSSVDLLQGPLVHDDLTQISTRWLPFWRHGRFGVAAFDAPGPHAHDEPFEIPMQSLALFACRRAAWPGCNRRLRGASYLEGYLHQKFNRGGGRTLCLPALRWMQHSARSTGVPSPSSWLDLLRNYLIEWDELGLPTDVVARQFHDVMGPETVSLLYSQWRAERNNPFLAFDDIFCINLDDRPDRWERMCQRFARLGIDGLVRRVSGVPTANNHVGCALSHRRVFEMAQAEGLETILVFEDDTVFLDGALWVLGLGLQELARHDWRLLYLGTFPSPHYPLVQGGRNLEVAHGLLGLHAAAYKRQTYEMLLEEMPNDIQGMVRWAERHPIDKYIADTMTDGVFRVSPMVAVQECLLPDVREELRGQYFIDWAGSADAAPVASTSGQSLAVPRSRDDDPSRVLPTVTAVMVTGHDERRRSLARQTAQAFPEQTYSAAELLIINQGREPLLTEPVERVREVMDGKSLVVGALRNLAWDYAHGDLMTCWDDDDIHHRERIAYQVAAYKGWPVALKNELTLHLINGHGFVHFYDFGFANTLLWPRDCTSRYSEEVRGSDSHFQHCLGQEFGRITRLDNRPSLYVRVFHGRNVWDESHMIDLPYRNAAQFPTIRVGPPTPDERHLLDELLTAHRRLAPWADPQSHESERGKASVST